MNQRGSEDNVGAMLVSSMSRSLLASPFGEPDPAARAAAEELVRALRDDRPLWRALSAPDGGKMFGVLRAVDAAGATHVLRAFSGMLDGTWHVSGFVGPSFDEAARDAFWIEGEASLGVLADELAAIERRRERVGRDLAPIAQRHAGELAALAERHRANKHARRSARTTASPERVDQLASESRRDTAERERVLARHVAERASLDAELRALDDDHRRIAEQRVARSRALLVQIHDTYTFTNARGERRTLRDLFAPAEPPGGAGDCAAPKLFAEAYRRGLRPVGIAEIWVGAPPATGGRQHGACYPACRGKCGPILGHMLGGLDVEPAPVYGAAAIATDEPRTVYEDDSLVIVDKPVGLLSVPGRGAALRDCVLARLRARYPDATGPMIVHRLDLDTSGLLLVAKDEAIYKALQAQFARREVEKRYVAWLAGAVERDAGTVDLALRVDVDDRPRQIHDPIHGKPAFTTWRVDRRERDRTRVILVPATGRTHQLRVHAAHPLGIGAPIVGDRLYGTTTADRLHLHAEAIAFVHPITGARIDAERPAPF